MNNVQIIGLLVKSINIRKFKNDYEIDFIITQMDSTIKKPQFVLCKAKKQVAINLYTNAKRGTQLLIEGCLLSNEVFIPPDKIIPTNYVYVERMTILSNPYELDRKMTENMNEVYEMFSPKALEKAVKKYRKQVSEYQGINDDNEEEKIVEGAKEILDNNNTEEEEEQE